MKALLVIDNDDTARIVEIFIRPLGIDVIRYRDPLKALDNLEEIEPHAVIMSAQDFPRHWKSIVVNIRVNRNKAECAIILLKGEWFPFEEAAKAAHLGVNGVVRESLADEGEIRRFQKILKRYIEVDETKATERLIPDELDRIGFMFNHPIRFTPIVGHIDTISRDSLTFKPDAPALVTDVEAGSIIPDACLRIDNAIMYFSCRITRTGPILAFSLQDIPQATRQTLVEYLENRINREMNALLKRS
jgi:hypothetical protein